MNLNVSNVRFAGLVLSLGIVSGCSTMSGQPAAPLSIQRDDPTIALCMSQRTSDGGLRIIGKIDAGTYPVTGATIEYRTTSPSDAAPTAPSSTGALALANARSEKVTYRKGADEVVFQVGGDAARTLAGKVLWYRWILEYSRGGGRPLANATEVHRTSLDEAGVPRSAGTPGPDTSVGLPVTRRR